MLRTALSFCLLLAACGAPPVPVYLNPGVTARLALQEEAECREIARRAVPERPRTTVSPSIGIGVGDGNTDIIFGVGAGSDVFDYDTNAGLRGEAIGACMGAKGYRLIQLPACQGNVRPLESHPFETTGLCVQQGAFAAPL
jgi:hypothetical protein